MKNIAVFDQYGYVLLVTDDEYHQTYGKLPSDYRPNRRIFETEAEAREYQAKQNEYTRDRISDAASVLGGMTSEKKAASSRENGKKGGRPKKA